MRHPRSQHPGTIHKLTELAARASPDYSLDDVRFLKPIAHPGKILCVGVNYADRNAEYKDSSEQPKNPSLFVRFPDSLVAYGVPLLRPPESKQHDYEGEIALVIGRAGRRIPEACALPHVLGYANCNEGSIRDWIRHGKFNVTPGKIFEGSGALGCPSPKFCPPAILTGYGIAIRRQGAIALAHDGRVCTPGRCDPPILPRS
jgi:2-keto-4-pentenoate hydratase/2-oxohepta-3-ene-1,7-dioic acid hydratase in catechol pathway